MLRKLAVAVGIALTAPLSANADVFVSGRLTSLEASYLPSAAGFEMDAGYAGCPAGSYIQWRGPADDGNPDPVTAGFDMMTQAVVNHAPIGVSFSSGCTAHFLYILPPP
jgi:hypothetical protein